jgi:hypothetical protein
MLHIVVGGWPEGTYTPLGELAPTIPSFKPQSTFILRVPQCQSPRPNWDLPFLLPQAGESPTPGPLGRGVRGNDTLACESGSGGFQFGRLEVKA